MELGSLFLRMAVEGQKRVLVYLRKSACAEGPIAAHFTQSVVDYFSFHGNEGSLSAELHDQKLILTNDKTKPRVKIKRPPFCPISNLTPVEIDRLPDDIANRGIDCGAAVILHTGDNKILLTRRPNHLRTFPCVWVPPGGHIEKNETIQEAGLRELREETGIHLNHSDCLNSEMPVLALWESTFPPKLSLGLPKRHHIVVYMLARLKSTLTSDVLQSQLSLDPEEVGASAWLDRNMVEAITSAGGLGGGGVGGDSVGGGGVDSGEVGCLTNSNIPQEIRATISSDNGQVEAMIPTGPLLETNSDVPDIERVSTGTKFVLEEWLKVTTE